MTVDEIIDNTIKQEGAKYTDDPADSGGATRYGITQATLTLALHHPATKQDVANLTENQAKVIYKNLFFYGPRIDLLPESLQSVVYDFGVNAGQGTAIRALQTVCTLAGFPCNVDGLMGPATAEVVKTAYEAMGPLLNNAYCEWRCQFYEELAARRPKDMRFLKGWLSRANNFRVEV